MRYPSNCRASRGVMEKVRLYTADGEMVADVFVPAFEPPPDALLWGQRIFIRRDDGRYLEGFCWVALDEAEEGS